MSTVIGICVTQFMKLINQFPVNMHIKITLRTNKFIEVPIMCVCLEKKTNSVLRTDKYCKVFVIFICIGYLFH